MEADEYLPALRQSPQGVRDCREAGGPVAQRAAVTADVLDHNPMSITLSSGLADP